MYNTSMQLPYYCVGAPMNVFMLIHDSPRQWLVCRKINKFNHHLFDLRIYSYHQNSQTSLRIQMNSTTIQHPNYYSVGQWMYLSRFMIHRVIDWCVAKTTNSTITYLISESTRIIRKIKHRCGSWCTAHPFNTLITDPVILWMYLCQFMFHRVIDRCVAKTTNSTITYFVFP